MHPYHTANLSNETADHEQDQCHDHEGDRGGYVVVPTFAPKHAARTRSRAGSRLSSLFAVYFTSPIRTSRITMSCGVSAKNDTRLNRMLSRLQTRVRCPAISVSISVESCLRS